MEAEPSLGPLSSEQSVAVRIATRDDVAALFAVRTRVRENHLDLAQLAERGITPDSVAEMLARGHARAWIVEESQGVCGFSLADAQAGSISALFVGPEAEGRGYGRALLQVAEEWLYASGWSTIWLRTGGESHNRAHGFYRAAGWVMTGPIDHGDVRYEKPRAV
jgi:GNAT superfamily N-acetyltransferase